MVIANGLPKSGTHALMALLLTMGMKRYPGQVTNYPPSFEPDVCGTGPDLAILAMLPNSKFVHGHAAPFQVLAKNFTVIHILRDPRNVLVSYCRHRQRVEGLDIGIVEALRDYWGWGSFVELYRRFLGWRGLVPVVRFEEVAVALEPIAGGTLVGKPSRWQDWWDKAAEREWQRQDGPQLLVESGYAP